MSKDLTSQQEEIFYTFTKQEQLNEVVAKQFKHYLVSLLEWNQKFNLTALTDIKLVLKYHFQDSLRLKEEVDFNNVKSIADVGAGAGFPGIPLKLLYPHLRLVLIEVNNKKVKFLEYLIETLLLKNTVVYQLDWRTFLRNTEEDIDLFCSRAALPPMELIRIFKSSCVYQNAQLVYWASSTWQPNKKEEPFVFKEIAYEIGNKKRKFVFFKKEAKKEQNE